MSESAMSPPAEPDSATSVPASLIMLQFLAWVADRPRGYADTMEAWRSSCPRLSVWEDSIIEGLVCIGGDADRAVTLTPRGARLLQQSRRAAATREQSMPAKGMRKKPSSKIFNTSVMRTAAE
jgi:hypothetical protein